MQGQIDMNQYSIRNINPVTIHEDEVVPKQWIEINFLNRYSPASTMAVDLNMDGHRVSYLRAPEQNHQSATKGYACTKLPLLGGDMQGGIGMARNRISHLGEPEQNNDAVRLSSENDFYLRRDGSNWMRNDLSVVGHRVTRMANPQKDQDRVNKRTLDDMIQAQQLCFEEHFVSADAVSQLTGPVSFNGQKILNVGDPENNDAVNLKTLQTEISQNNMIELPKYLRLDGSSEPTSDLTMSDNQITNLANPTSPKDAATKKYVNDLITNPVGAAPAVVSADLDVNNFKITNLKNPTDGQDATNRRFVERNFVRKDQDINMRDHKIIGLHPLDVTQSDQSGAAPKGYVEREIFRQIDENNRVEAVKFLKVDGTSLPETDQDFNGQKIKNLSHPVDPKDDATVTFVDYRIGQRTFHVNLEGAQEKLKMNNNVISGLVNPTERHDAVHKRYVDSQIEYLQSLVTNLTRQVEGLQNRVMRLKRLSIRESMELPETVASK